MQCGSVPVPYPGALSVADAAALAQGTIMAAAERAVGTHVTGEMFNARHVGVQLLIAVTDINASGTLDVKIQVFDPIAAAWRDLPDAAAAQIVATGSAVFTVHPSVSEDAGVDVAAALPARWRVSTAVGTDAVAFSIAAFYLP
jgi:hypothetical protein